MPFPVDPKYVVDSEHKLGVQFPESYHAGMHVMNGGPVTEPWRLFPVFDTSNRKRIKRTANNVVRETEYAKRMVGFPEEAVAIGADDYGNYLVLIPEAKGGHKLRDTVYEWDHETGNLRVAFPTLEILMNGRT